jgi:hypothetical protein
MRESLQPSRGRGVWGALIDEHWPRYIDAGRLAGTLTLISRRGTMTYCQARGHLEVERRRPVAPDSVWRIYSMTSACRSTPARCPALIAFEGPAAELRTSPVIREKLGV